MLKSLNFELNVYVFELQICFSFTKGPIVRHTLLNPSQHEFLKERSCLTNMFFFFWEEISKRIDEGSPVNIMYLDFQKAFDKVLHQRLLLSLKAHGIRDGIIDWIEQWLTDRRQHVIIDGEVEISFEWFQY